MWMWRKGRLSGRVDGSTVKGTDARRKVERVMGVDEIVSGESKDRYKCGCKVDAKW